MGTRSDPRGAAIATIKAEHRSLAAVIEALKYVAAEIATKAMKPDFKLLWAMLYYIEGVPEKLHHPKEDEFLFKALRERCADASPLIDLLQRDHRAGDEQLRTLQRALGHFEAGAGEGIEAFAAAIDTFAGFTWQHMSREERELMPLAEKHLTEADWEVIAAAFEANVDPLGGTTTADQFRHLFTTIVSRVPAPMGLGSRS